jgi:hypothetical protein
MPARPLWLDRLPEALRQLEQSSEPWIDRPALETLLGIGRRRAQQLLAPLTYRRVGSSGVANRQEVMAHLRTIASGEIAYYEDRRRKRLWAHLNEARRDWVQQPPVLVEVPDTQKRRVELHDIEGLPEGVELSPGSISLRFRTPEEALQKLMTLALAIGRDRLAFEERVATSAEVDTDDQ